MSKYEEIKQRCDKATSMPWEIGYCGEMSEEAKEDLKKELGITYWPSADMPVEIHNKGTEVLVIDDWTLEIAEKEPYKQELLNDLEFIIHARTDIPLLLKALELACEDGNMTGTPDYWLEEAAK